MRSAKRLSSLLRQVQPAGKGLEEVVGLGGEPGSVQARLPGHGRPRVCSFAAGRSNWAAPGSEQAHTRAACAMRNAARPGASAQQCRRRPPPAAAARPLGLARTTDEARTQTLARPQACAPSSPTSGRQWRPRSRLSRCAGRRRRAPPCCSARRRRLRAVDRPVNPRDPARSEPCMPRPASVPPHRSASSRCARSAARGCWAPAPWSR